jgi:hypothetical protein
MEAQTGAVTHPESHSKYAGRVGLSMQGLGSHTALHCYMSLCTTVYSQAEGEFTDTEQISLPPSDPALSTL